MLAAFRSYDKTLSGFLDEAKFVDALLDMGWRIYPHDRENILRLFCSLYTGLVNYIAFCDFVCFTENEMYVKVLRTIQLIV